MPGKHARWSPSSSPYWYNEGKGCPARAMMPRVEEETSSPAALEGTRKHELCEVRLSTGEWPESASLSDIEELRNYVQYVEDRSLLANLTIEEVALLEPITGEPGATGSIDALLVDDNYLEIVDLKTGAKRVSPDSSQLKMYAAAVALELDYDGREVAMTVHQGGEAHTHRMSTRELMWWAAEVKSYVEHHERKLHETRTYEFRPSDDNCTWCPFLETCPALKEYRDKIAAQDFAAFDATKADPDEMAEALTMIGPLRKWATRVEQLALEQAKVGNAPTGFKLVAARTNRKYTDEAESILVELLGDAAYNRSLIGVTAADKLVDAETMQRIAIAPPGKPTLAPESDPRPALSDAAADFKDV